MEDVLEETMILNDLTETTETEGQGAESRERSVTWMILWLAFGGDD